MSCETSKKDDLFMTLAYTVAQGSKDRSKKVGAVIVGKDKEIVSMGWNGFPRGINDSVEERHDRPLKYKFVCHAEINAITNAARIGVSCKNCTMYITAFCCHECAKSIIQAGIVKVVFNERWEHWEDSFKIAEVMLEEAGVEVEKWDGEFLEIDKPN